MSLKLKGKLCVVQPKTVCRSSHHCGADGNFGTNTSRFVAFGVFEHKRNVTIVFNFYAVEAASEVVPFLFSWDSRIGLGRQRHIGPWPFPLVDLRWCNCLNRRLVQRHRGWISFDRPATTALFGPDTRKATRKSLYPLSQILRTPSQ